MAAQKREGNILSYNSISEINYWIYWLENFTISLSSANLDANSLSAKHFSMVSGKIFFG